MLNDAAAAQSMALDDEPAGWPDSVTPETHFMQRICTVL